MNYISNFTEKSPVTADEIYVVLACLMLMCIVQRPTLHSYFTRNSVLATPIFGSVISMD
jgi:ABC-type glucose/galactose transport system permease subunit